MWEDGSVTCKPQWERETRETYGLPGTATEEEITLMPISNLCLRLRGKDVGSGGGRPSPFWLCGPGWLPWPLWALGS